jgi:hypothetical protein
VKKSFDVIIYVINRIYKVCLHLFGLVLNVLLIFCVKILREMEKRERKKKVKWTFICSSPSPRYRNLPFKKKEHAH